MFIVFVSLSVMTRAQKTVVDNCYEKDADVNVFVDTNQIFVRLTPTLNPACDFPHGMKLSIVFDAIKGFEPYGFQYEYDYTTSNMLNITCTNATACQNLSLVTTGQIIVESKTLVNYVATGAVRVSRR